MCTCDREHVLLVCTVCCGRCWAERRHAEHPASLQCPACAGPVAPMGEAYIRRRDAVRAIMRTALQSTDQPGEAP